MSRITHTFKQRPAFIGYLTAGDGDMASCLHRLLALVAGGVDMLEIGVPFSDPVADGPVIQRAMVRGLANNVGIFDVLQLVREVRQYTDVPIILFGYLNPLLAAMRHNFFKAAKESGVDGILIVDLPIEASAPYMQPMREHGIAPILVVTPSTSAARIQTIQSQTNAFLYYACRKGITGVRSGLPDGYEQKMQEIKAISQVPVVAGFGIADRVTAKAVLQQADGFVVGSRFVSAVEEGASPAELTALAQAIDPRGR